MVARSAAESRDPYCRRMTSARALATAPGSFTSGEGAGVQAPSRIVSGRTPISGASAATASDSANERRESPAHKTGLASSLPVIQVRQQQEDQPQDENGAHPVERIERRQIEHQDLDHSEPRHGQAGEACRLQGAAEPDADQRSREYQPPGADGQSRGEARVLRGQRLQLEVASDLSGDAEQHHGTAQRPERASHHRGRARGDHRPPEPSGERHHYGGRSPQGQRPRPDEGGIGGRALEQRAGEQLIQRRPERCQGVPAAVVALEPVVERRPEQREREQCPHSLHPIPVLPRRHPERSRAHHGEHRPHPVIAGDQVRDRNDDEATSPGRWSNQTGARWSNRPPEEERGEEKVERFAHRPAGNSRRG